MGHTKTFQQYNLNFLYEWKIYVQFPPDFISSEYLSQQELDIKGDLSPLIRYE